MFVESTTSAIVGIFIPCHVGIYLLRARSLETSENVGVGGRKTSSADIPTSHLGQQNIPKTSQLRALCPEGASALADQRQRHDERTAEYADAGKVERTD